MQAYAQSAETTASSSSSVAGELPALQLKSSSLLQESYPQEVRDQQPTYIKGDSLSGQPDLKASVHGEAELRRGDTMIRADKLDYAVPDDRINAVGSVVLLTSFVLLIIAQAVLRRGERTTRAE